MPNSPKCIVKRLYHNGTISEHERDKLIKALEQELCDDAISRTEAILQIQRHGVGCFDAEEFTPEESERFVIGMLNKLPPVNTQELKTGRWIICDTLQEFKCSECRVCFRNKSNYCPNCGAKMKSEDKNESVEV